MKKICLDANILLEILFHRTRYDKVIEMLGNIEEVQFCVSILSADLVMYFVEIEKASKDRAWEFLEKYEKIEVLSKDLEWAHANDAGDFEGALQVGCARRHGCSEFVTLDQTLGKMYGKYIPVQTIK